jgi:hypothetical protein
MPGKPRNRADALEWEYIQELKADHSQAYRLPSADGVARVARILHRGEQLFYQQGDRAVILEISLPGAFVDLKSARKWDDGSKIDEQSKESIFQHLKPFFRTVCKVDLSRE